MAARLKAPFFVREVVSAPVVVNVEGKELFIGYRFLSPERERDVGPRFYPELVLRGHPMPQRTSREWRAYLVERAKGEDVEKLKALLGDEVKELAFLTANVEVARALFGELEGEERAAYLLRFGPLVADGEAVTLEGPYRAAYTLLLIAAGKVEEAKEMVGGLGQGLWEEIARDALRALEGQPLEEARALWDRVELSPPLAVTSFHLPFPTPFAAVRIPVRGEHMKAAAQLEPERALEVLVSLKGYAYHRAVLIGQLIGKRVREMELYHSFLGLVWAAVAEGVPPSILEPALDALKEEDRQELMESPLWKAMEPAWQDLIMPFPPSSP